MEQTNTTKQHVVIINEDHCIIPNCRYSNYIEALEAINTINHDVALALIKPKNSNVKPYPVPLFVMHMVKAAFMTGKEMSDALTLGCSFLETSNDTHIQFYTNYIKVSGATNVTFATFRDCVYGEIKFFSDPEKFYEHHITGFIQP